MLYLLGVYGLVVIVVLLPVLLLYALAGISWLVLATVRALRTHLEHIFAAQTDFLSKQHWSTTRR
jgi:hypothetical protein